MVGRVRRSERDDDECLFYIAPRHHIAHNYCWRWRVVNFPRARSRHFYWRVQHEHTTVGETNTPITDKLYPHLMASSKVHTKRSLTLRHARVSYTFAKTRHNLGSISRGFRWRTAPSSALPRRGMLRRCGTLTMTATNVFRGMVPWRRAATRGSTVSLFHALSSLFILTKRSLQSLTLQKSTLGDTDDDIGTERSAKGCLRTFTRKLKLR